MHFTSRTLGLATLLLATALGQTSHAGFVYSVTLYDSESKLGRRVLTGGTQEVFGSDRQGGFAEIARFGYASTPAGSDPNFVPLFNLSAQAVPITIPNNPNVFEGGQALNDFFLEVLVTNTVTNSQGMLELIADGYGTFGSSATTSSINLGVNNVEDGRLLRSERSGRGLTFLNRLNNFTVQADARLSKTLIIDGQSITFSLPDRYGVAKSQRDPNPFAPESAIVSLTTSVPEPTSLTLLGIGSGALAVARLRRRKGAV